MATERSTAPQKRLDPEKEYKEYETLPDLITAISEGRVDSDTLYIVADSGDFTVYGRYPDGDGHEFFTGSEDEAFAFVAYTLGGVYVHP